MQIPPRVRSCSIGPPRPAFPQPLTTLDLRDDTPLAAGRERPALDWADLDEQVLRLVRSLMRSELRRYLDSGDVKQEVLKEILRSEEQFDPRLGHAFQAWVSGIVKHRLSNLSAYHHAMCRNGARRRPLEYASEVADPGPQPVLTAEMDEEQERILLALESLHPHERLLIVLRNFESLPWLEVAKRLGKPSPDAARVAYSRAMLRLYHFSQRR